MPQPFVWDLSRYVFEPLRKGRELDLYRGRPRGPGATILVVAQGQAQPPAGAAGRLEHEYSLAGELDPAWAAQPVALAHHEGRTVLVLEDAGGAPLANALGAPFEMARFLPLAICLAAALHQVHQRGLIHKDVNPENVLVDAAGNVRFTGFGIASRLPRERQAPATPEVIAGTLAYMAPEQTGRMNRSTDARSDLYAMGVIMYEMLTGALPFEASDAMGWIHCHIARRPVPPSERISAVPAAVDAIILKLLAKDAEDRYQTAAGVERDLRLCLALLQAHGRIDPFPLAAQDATPWLVTPERLYGRETEVALLLAAFNSVAAQGGVELVLVRGDAGMGKSSIVNELHKVLIPSGALFGAGKFDQYKRDVPYATLAQAFQSLVSQLLGKNEAELGRWRGELLEALGPHGALMVNLIPELTLLIGEQPPVPDLPPQEAQTRFQQVFWRFLGVFARPAHPLAIFLDDLQWLDQATLQLLERLATGPAAGHLLLVGAYRDNEVGPAHPLARTLEVIRGTGNRVREIALGALKLDGMERLVADTLRSDPARVRPLAEVVLAKTGGNPFFATQFLAELAGEGSLSFSAETSRWQWDLSRIAAVDVANNLADLMTAKLARLSDTAKAALGQLACLGNVSDIAMIGLVHAASKELVLLALREAVGAGLVFRIGETTYMFIHDHVREAAYALVPRGERAAAHLRIGRALVARAAGAGAQLQEEIFDIVGQLNSAATLIQAAQEREQVARLNLMAGQRARNSTAYASALAYFAAGCAVLPQDSWERWYRLTFDLEFRRAECEFLTGQLAAAQARLFRLSARATNLADLAAVACLRMALYTTLYQADRAVDVGLDFLRHVGVDWAPHPAGEVVHAEMEATRKLLAQRRVEELIDLPPMSDPECLATVAVLADLLAPATFLDNNLFDLALLRMTNLSVANGNCDSSPFAYSLLNIVLGIGYGDFDRGLRFGQLACDLVDGRGFDRFKARVYSSFGTFVLPWTKHLPLSHPVLRRAMEMSSASGDVIFEAYSRLALMSNIMSSGEPLANVQRQAEESLAFASKAQFGLAADCFVEELLLIRELREPGLDEGSATTLPQDRQSFERHLEEAGPLLATVAARYWIHRMQAWVLAGDAQSALAARTAASGLIWTMRPFLEVVEYHFYGALALSAAADGAPVERRQWHLDAMEAHRAQIARWATGCPGNLAHREALIAAEIARLDGRELDAERLYEEAIRSSREYGFVQNEGLGNELAAGFHAARGFHTIAHAYRRNARACYARWGALAKVRQLDRDYALASDAPVPLAASAPDGQIDVGALLKAAQALSGEIVLDALIEKLVRITVEHAGAERGVLVLLRGGEPQVRAVAAVADGKLQVARREDAVSPGDLPESVFRYVARARKSVILDDACASHEFSDDAYVKQHRPRSLLCLPILRQGALAGVLYLENNLVRRAFTPGRIAVLELLASQAAVSLQSAYMYADLERSQALLAAGQKVSKTGTWSWNVTTGNLALSDENYRILGFDRGVVPTVKLLRARVHPGDQAAFHKAVETVTHGDKEMAVEYRIVLDDGSVRHIHSVGQPVLDQAGKVREYIGSTMDITERRTSEDALRDAQARLAHISRLTTMGELVASIAHEVNQPLAAMVTNAETCLLWLEKDQPNLDRVRNAAQRIVRDGHQAGDVISSIRAMVRKAEPARERLDFNAVIMDVLALLREEVRRRNISLELDLPDGAAPIMGSRSQLQQVIVNLIMNSVEAMSDPTLQPRTLRIKSAVEGEGGNVLTAVEDTGPGLDEATLQRIFEPFFTTKREGMGMGLSICRSIVESHGGRLWAAPKLPHGCSFQFTLPPAAAG